MGYESFIAKRYLKSKKRKWMLSSITLFSFIVIILGCSCITIFLSIMNGFESVVIDRFLRVDSHIQVVGKGELNFPDHEGFVRLIEGLPGIAGYSPFIMDKVMLSAEKGKMPVNLKAIDLKTVNNVSKIRSRIELGSDDFTSYDSVQTRPGIILGTGVADRLGAMPGDIVRVMSTRGIDRYMREPDVKTFEVTGFFESEIPEYDYLYVFTSIKDAQKLFRMGSSYTGFDINAENFEDAEILAENIRTGADDNILVKTWYDLHKNLYSSMELEKIAAFIILSLIILVASFSIASSLIMLVLKKRNEIGILKSMGSSAKEIRKVFLLDGMIIGIAGTIIGLTIGYTTCWIQLNFGLIKLPHDVYIISDLPVKISQLDFVLVGLVSILLTFFATVYPARKAGNMKPSQALRYE